MTDFETPGAGFNVGAFLSSAVSEGWSGRKALAEFRDAGMSMSNESFRSLYSSARDALANRDVMAALDYDAAIPLDAMTPWVSGADGNYASFIESFVRMPGERQFESRFYTHVTNEPHSPQEAIDAAAQFYIDAQADNPGYALGNYHGSVVTSTTFVTPPEV